MKTFECESNIGEGLFSDESITVEISFPDGSSGVFNLFALTPRRVIALKKDGVKFEDHKNEAEAVDHSERIIAAIVESGHWQDVEINDENKYKIVGNLGLTSAIINASRTLAEERFEAEAGNSEN